MSYATRADMVSRFGEGEVIALTDRSNAGVIDDAVLASALTEADAEIEPYLASRYTLPLASVPKVLTGIACDVARYRLSGAAVAETEPVRLRYRDAIRFLEAVASGKVLLGVDAGGAAPVAGGVEYRAAAKVFDAASLNGY